VRLQQDTCRHRVGLDLAVTITFGTQHGPAMPYVWRTSTDSNRRSQ
jgi:hypothetical protein